MNEEIGYNTGNEHANDEWTGEIAGQPITGKIVEQISKDEMPYVTVSGCAHKETECKQSDEFDGVFEYTCKSCPIGWYAHKESR